jgi:hypothetical protein
VILKKNVFMCFVITIYMMMWCGGWMVKILGCGWGDENSNLIFDMLFPRHHDDDLLYVSWEEKKSKTE